MAAEVVTRRPGAGARPRDAVLHRQPRRCEALFARDGFHVVAAEVGGLTPHELVAAHRRRPAWQDEAAPSTLAVYDARGVVERLRTIFRQTLLNDDGELGHARDFQSYGAQMDASLRQKLDDLLPWVMPGRIVDKGCGTGKLLVELSRLFPSRRWSASTSRASSCAAATRTPTPAATCSSCSATHRAQLRRRHRRPRSSSRR